VLSVTGPIISPAFSFSWQQETIDIQRNSDRIVLFTDAIIEAESEAGPYGIERLVEEITTRPADGKVLAEQILQSLVKFTGGRPINDDLTLVVADL